MISEFAPAKLNLTLRVGPVRDDGYHPVDSLVMFADWGDRLGVAPGDQFEITYSGEGAQALQGEPDNLVLKTARLLHKAAELPHSTGARFHLDKTIPLGSGLGGGSANAAAALRALNRLWALDWPLEDLARLGGQVGSDVPACVWSQPLHMTGRGEQIDLITTWPEFNAVLCLPGIPVSTARIFAAYDKSDPKTLTPSTAYPVTRFDEAVSLIAASSNDLEPVAIREIPVIATCMDKLRDCGDPALVRMSGSGSTVFAIYERRTDADKAAAALCNTHPDWTCASVTLGGT